VLDANDNRPEFERPVYDVRVPESTPVGSVLVQVRARDRDAGLNSNVRYKFSRHTAHEYATLFGIRPDNGKIFLQRGEALLSSIWWSYSPKRHKEVRLCCSI